VSYLIHFTEKSTIEDVGAKALNLSRLVRFELKVPEAWFLPVSALHDFLQDSHLGEKLQAVKQSRSLGKCQEAAAILRREIMLSPLQPALLVELKDFLEKHSSANFSVRSSSVNEDLEQHSFAGQYSSVLNVVPLVSAIAKNIKVVWASQWSEAIISYAFKHSLPIPGPDMGVILQQMVDPEIAGVLFSYNPYTFNKNEMIIEYVRGLGESLVSGEETPVHLTYNRSRKNLDNPTGSLSKSYLRAIRLLIDTAAVLEKKSGLAVDIEWAYAQGEVWFLQLRSITNYGQQGTLWTDENVGEVIPDIVTPYTWSILNPITNNAFMQFLKSINIKEYPVDGLFGLYKGKVYFNNTAFDETLSRFYLSGAKQGGNGKRFFGIGHKLSVPFRLLFALLHFWRFSGNLPLLIQGYMKKYKAVLKTMSFAKTMSAADSYSAMNKIIDLHGQTMFYHISDTILAELYYQFLKKMTDRWVQTKTGFGADALLLGMGDADSALSGAALWTIALKIKQNPALIAAFEKENCREVEQALAAIAGGRKILQMLSDFINRFGHGALHEFELLYPRWWEDRNYIYTNIRNYLTTNVSFDFDGAHEKIKQQRKDNLKQARPLIPFGFRLLFDYLYKKAAYFSGERENLKQAFIKAHSELKKHLLNIGYHLTKEKILKCPEDILFLRQTEIKKYLADIPPRDGVQKEVDARRAQRSRFIREKHPARMMQMGEIWRPAYDDDDMSDTDGLKGIGCSAGVIEGRACIILNDSQFSKLKQGDILVTQSTNPGWTPLFVIAGGVITEIGGALSHGAIIAREYGIPMVAAVKNATVNIKDGDRLRVNGHTGSVYILNK